MKVTYERNIKIDASESASGEIVYIRARYDKPDGGSISYPLMSIADSGVVSACFDPGGLAPTGIVLDLMGDPITAFPPSPLPSPASAPLADLKALADKLNGLMLSASAEIVRSAAVRENEELVRLRKLLEEVGSYIGCHGFGAVYNPDSCMRCDELKRAYEAAKGGAA